MKTDAVKIAGSKLADRLRHPSLRARFFLGALLLATVPLVALSIILPLRVRSTLTAMGHEHLAQVARDLAALTENEMQRNLETVRSLAAMDSLRDALRRHHAGKLDPAGVAAINHQLRALLQALAGHHQGLFLCGADGFFFAGVLETGEVEPYTNLDVRDRAYFRDARTTLQPVISDPLRSKIGQVPIVAVVVPVQDERGAFVGLVGLAIEIEPLATFISGQKLGRGGYPFAIDRHGLIVAHPDPERAFRLNLRDVPGATRLAERMTSGATGVETYTSSKGEHKLAAFAPVPRCGWSIAASMETAEFGAPAQHIRIIIFAMIGAGIIIAVVVAVILAMGLEQLKQALAAALASEARFKLFASVAHETIWDWNLQTDELWWNEGVTTVFGYPPGALEKTSAALTRRIGDAERAAVLEGIRSCHDGSPWTGEHHFLRHDGTLAYVLHRAAAVRDAGGRAVRVIGSMTDISHRRAAEEKLAEQAALLDQARDGILVRDLDHIIRFWNRSAEAIYGWTAAEAVGRRVDELLHVNPASFAEAEQRVLQNGEWFGHLQKTTKAGAILTLDCRWTLLRDAEGRPRSILTIDTDITERIQMEAKFLRAQRLESIGTLAGGIAHDLNNLLSPIVMGVGLLKLAGHSEDDRKIIHYIEQSALRGTHLVKQVLSFARGVEGARVSVHVGYVVREVEAIIRSTFPKDITVRIQIAKDLWLVTADPTQLNQVLLNLCVNARDAMPQGGQLSLSVQNVLVDEHFVQLNHDVTPGPHVMIEVADTGTGMPQSVLDKLFEPFFTTKAPGKGTGLGLSTVIGITRSHGGTVNVYSELGRGSAFKIYLPAALGGTAGPDPSATTPPLEGGHGELILLVDDEQTIRNVTRQALESFGYRVLTASDGAEAFALYHQHRAEIRLVLTDMMMPLMDGSALIAALRVTNPRVVVVAASGLHDNNNQIKAGAADIRHFLCKPYTTESLLCVIRAALADAAISPAGS